jgi:hypothetical protein
MRTSIAAFIVLPLFAAVACTAKNTANKPDTTTPAAATTPSSDPAAVRQAIDSANARFTAAMTKGDTIALTSNYASDAIILAPNGKAVHGTAEIRKFFSSMSSGASVPAFKLTTQGTADADLL